MPEERDRAILRKTLAIVSWLYAGEHLLYTPLLFLPRAAGGRGMLWAMTAHMLVLAVAGIGLLKSRPWAWPMAALAALGAAGLSAVMVLERSILNAVLYAGYALLVPALWRFAREARLTPPSPPP